MTIKIALVSLIILNVLTYTFSQNFPPRPSVPPKYTVKKLVENQLDTLKFKYSKPLVNGLIEGEITDYILAETSYFDVDDSKTTPIRGGGKLVMCFKGRMKKGKKEGVVKAYFLENTPPYNLILNMEQSYKNDQRQGEWKTYDLSGNLIRIQHFDKDSIDGIEINYWFDGKKVSEKTFKNGKLEGKSMEYSREGIAEKETYYKNGQLDGICKQFYPSGKVMEEQGFKNGDFDGHRKYYYENGQLWTELIIKNNKPWQAVSNFDEKGKPRDAGTLKDGNGTVIYYNEDGKIRETLKYQNGNQVY